MAALQRPPRSGARPGALSAELRTALRAEAHRLEALTDPVDIVTGVGNTFAALDAELERLAKVRLKAVHRLRREGWSYDRIAAATGLSKGRIAQLSKDPRGRT
jgi:DNA-directed RNA polymerase specialized sigma24 family protein